MSVFVLVLLLSSLITFALFSIIDICKLLCIYVKGVILNEDSMMMMMRKDAVISKSIEKLDMIIKDCNFIIIIILHIVYI